MDGAREGVVDHFTARARTYDASSSWCTDDALGDLILDLAKPTAHDRVLDVACGTGLVSRRFSGRVAEVVGVDVTRDMADKARPYLDRLCITSAESMPFSDGEFDVVVCRQGIQFMTLPDAVEEMVRVTRPAGRIVLAHLCAYGEDDRDDYFEILRLRNPVRRHFFLPDEPVELLRAAGCDQVDAARYVSVEDVDVWSDNGAIDDTRRKAIREVYRRASPQFHRRHAVRESDSRFVDHMLFVVAGGTKPKVAENSVVDR